MRMRVQFAKEGRHRFLSHLDLQRTLLRAFRRAGLPVAFTHGFNPHPRLSFGSALSTGASSEGEFFDLDLAESVQPPLFVASLNGVLPDGIRVMEAHEVSERGESLMSLINAARYRLTLKMGPADPQALEPAVAAFLEREAVVIFRDGKKGQVPVEIRSQVYQLAAEEGPALLVAMQSGLQGNLKPEELLAGLKTVTPELEPVCIRQVHRLICCRRDPVTGRCQLPWEL